MHIKIYMLIQVNYVKLFNCLKNVTIFNNKTNFKVVINYSTNNKDNSLLDQITGNIEHSLFFYCVRGTNK